MDHVKGPKPTNNSPEKVDRTNQDKFVVDLEGGIDLHCRIQCVWKVICEKALKSSAIHNVLRDA